MAARGTTARANRPRNPSPSPATPRTSAVRPGADAVPGRHQGDRLGPVAGLGLLGRHHHGDGVGGRQHRPAEREQGHEPPVAGAQGGQGGDGQAAGHAAEQHPAAAVAVGQGGQRQAGQGRQAHDGQPDPQGGAGQPDPGHHRGAVAGLAEGPGHVAKGGGGPELGEAGGHGGRGHGQDGRMVPAVQPDAAGGGGVGAGVARRRRPRRPGRGHVAGRPGCGCRPGTLEQRPRIRRPGRLLPASAKLVRQPRRNGRGFTYRPGAGCRSPTAWEAPPARCWASCCRGGGCGPAGTGRRRGRASRPCRVRIDAATPPAFGSPLIGESSLGCCTDSSSVSPTKVGPVISQRGGP